MSLKTWLLKKPAVYEFVQGVRDRRLHSECQKAGSFSQHGEDKFILELLAFSGDRGNFVDIGCNHPFKYNNTYLLHQQGWRGICIDPLPRFRPLYKKWRPQDQFVCAAVGQIAGEIMFYEFEWDMLSTMDPTLADSYQAAGHRLLRKSTVPVLPLDTLLEQHGISNPISLLSLDVEGYELTVLQSIDFDRWQPKLVCLEVQTADGNIETVAADYLIARGYSVAHDLGLNVILKRNT